MSEEDEWGVPWDDCGCPGGAPSQFLVPPPPPPALLGHFCAEGHCDAIEGGPMGAHFDGALAFPSLPIVAVCSSVVLVAILVASFLLWRHKTKVQNLLPCKHDQQGHLGELTSANGVSYEDVLINHHNTRMPPGQTLMPMELLDVKLGDIGPPEISALQRTPYFATREPGQVIGSKPFHPVYEEVSRDPSADKSVITRKSYESDLEESGKLGGRSMTTSEDDFPEDGFSAAEYPSGEGSGQCSATSSVRGSTGGDLCRDPVSSDEGMTEDLDYMVNDLPEMLQSSGGGDAFDYSRKHLGLCTDVDKARPGHNRGNRHPHTPERTANYPNHKKPHSKDGKTRVLSPSQPCLSYSPTVSTGNLKGSPHVTLSPNAQWMAQQPQDDRIQYPHPDSENIYSTIDEDEMVEYPSPVHPSFTSLGCPQRGRVGIPTRHSPAVPKNASSRRDRGGLVSQRSNEDCSGSPYGDIMPAYNATPFS